MDGVLVVLNWRICNLMIFCHSRRFHCLFSEFPICKIDEYGPRLPQCGSSPCTTMHQSSLQAKSFLSAWGTGTLAWHYCALQHWCRDRAVSPRAYLLLSTGLMVKKDKNSSLPPPPVVTTQICFFHRTPGATAGISCYNFAKKITSCPLNRAPHSAFLLRHSLSAFSLLRLMHTGKPTGVAVSHCITWFQTRLILTTCQIRYHSHLWGHRSTGQL